MIAFMFDRLVDWFECIKLAIYVLTLSHKMQVRYITKAFDFLI